MTGKGKKVNFSQEGSYFQKEFVSEELPHFFALADLVVSRAGANSLFEYLELSKAHVTHPFRKRSRGDQIDNAKCFAEKGWAKVSMESSLTPKELVSSISRVMNDTAMKQKLELEQKKRVATKTLYFRYIRSFQTA